MWLPVSVSAHLPACVRNFQDSDWSKGDILAGSLTLTVNEPGEILTGLLTTTASEPTKISLSPNSDIRVVKTRLWSRKHNFGTDMVPQNMREILPKRPFKLVNI